MFSDCYFPVKNGVVTVIHTEKNILNKKGHNVFVFAPETPGYQDNEKNVFYFKSIPVGMGTEQRFAFPNMKKIYDIVKNEKIQIIHIHSEFSMKRAALKVAKKFNLPAILTTHTDWENYYKHYGILKYILPRFFVRKFITDSTKGMRCLISPSKKVQNYYNALAPKAKTIVIPNAMDEQMFKINSSSKDEVENIRIKYKISKDDIVGLFVGRVGDEKRVSFLIENIIKAFKQTKEGKFIVVGDGPMLSHLKEMTNKNDLKDRIIYTGFLPWNEVSAFYSAASYFATASLTEICSMTALEAMVSGKPLVASNDLSLVGKLIHEENGYLVKDDKDFSDYILKIQSDKNMLKIFSKKSLEIASTFTIEMHEKRLSALYKYVAEHDDKSFDEKEIEKIIDSL